jgi:pyruvate,water dikinase
MPPKSWWWVLTGLLPAYPKFFTKLVPLWRDELHPEYKDYVDNAKMKDSSNMNVEELWREAQSMVDGVMYYVCALMFATMGASAGSEMLLTKVYDRFAKRDEDPPASVLLMGWDNIPIRSEKSLFDLAGWISKHSQLRRVIEKTPSTEIAGYLKVNEVLQEVDLEIWAEFQDRYEKHIGSFGHAIYQLDFAMDLPVDHPEPMLETIKMYLRGEGKNPHERQLAGEQTRLQTADKVDQHLRGLKRWAFRKALGWGQSLAEVREDALADIGLGYPKLRELLFRLGRHFTEAGIIKTAKDITWLEKEEISREIRKLMAGADVLDLTAIVVERKDFHKCLKEVTPPPMIPLKERVMGVKSELFVSHIQDSDAKDTLKGVPASAGVVTAPACVLQGPEDFNLMNPGDILVAGTTTPAWTPLFVMASGVVTDIGGPLSHGSIVAREYGIPAVMGTGEATRRIKNRQMILVDGGKGMVTILKRSPNPQP